MSNNFSGIITVLDFFSSDSVTIHNTKSGRLADGCLDFNRIYIVPAYQREIKWSKDNVQILIDDLCKGSKFLGTIILSSSELKHYEIIDGQQRITVITLLFHYLNSKVPDKKQVASICELNNASFPYFQDVLKYNFDDKAMKKLPNDFYDKLVASDVLSQKDRLSDIWKSIVERIDSLDSDSTLNLFTSLKESEFNVILNNIEKTESQKKFCADYFIDINNKSVKLDGIDIIRAFAFKDDFDSMTETWVKLQKKCSSLSNTLKLTLDDLFYHYFICKSNSEISFTLTKPLMTDYSINENIKYKNHNFSKGTPIWNILLKPQFYSNMLEDLNSYLDFVSLIFKNATGGNYEIKEVFLIQGSNDQLSDTTIKNAHTIINSILRYDDSIPKMMILKFYLEILKPQNINKADYHSIYDINAIATMFSCQAQSKRSTKIATALISKKWINALKTLAFTMFSDIPSKINFSRTAAHNKDTLIESGQFLAKRFFSLCDAYTKCENTLNVNPEIFKNINDTSSNKNLEHFLINRNFTYSLYKDDGNTEDIQINLPSTQHSKIATISNYLILDSQINRELKNLPVYKKINLLEEFIQAKGIDNVIGSKQCQLHYYLIKQIFYDNSKFPKSKLDHAKTSEERITILSEYYAHDFKEEFNKFNQSLSKPEELFSSKIKYKLSKLGFKVSEIPEHDNIMQLEISQKNNFILEAIFNYSKDYLILNTTIVRPAFSDANYFSEIANSIQTEIETIRQNRRKVFTVELINKDSNLSYSITHRIKIDSLNYIGKYIEILQKHLNLYDQ